MQRFAGKVALITGGAQGIGLASAVRLHAEGAKVVIGDIQPWAETAAFKEFSDNPDIRYVLTDVSDRVQVDALVGEAVSAFGEIDVLLSNVGAAFHKPFLDLTEAEFEHYLRLNLVSMFSTGQAVARQMQRQGRGGSIIHMSSVNAVMAMVGYACYNVPKGGVQQLTRVMALELAPLGIRVNAVGPGTILTELARSVVMADAATTQRVMSRTPLGRFGEPEEVAATIAFLASDDASYITGETIFIDGGRMALNYTVPVNP